MNKKKRKKIIKKIITHMKNGSLPHMVSASLSLPYHKFEELINSHKDIQEAYQLGLTLLRAYYELRLTSWMQTGRGDKDLIKVFYSNYFDIMEKKEETKMNNDININEQMRLIGEAMK